MSLAPSTTTFRHVARWRSPILALFMNTDERGKDLEKIKLKIPSIILLLDTLTMCWVYLHESWNGARRRGRDNDGCWSLVMSCE